MAELNHTHAVTINNVLTIIGTADADDIVAYGTSENLNIEAGSGDDEIYATNGDNVINAGDGDDLIHFTNGTDTVDSGNGKDQVHFNFESIFSLRAFTNNNGLITITTRNGSTTTYSNVEIFSFGNGMFTPTYTAEVLGHVYSTSDQIIQGTVSANTLPGGAYNDTINTGDGDDLVFGALGNDTINGGNGNDRLYGGFNVEKLYDQFEPAYGDDDGDDVLNGGNGNDTFYGHNGNDFYNGGLGDDVVYGGYENDTFVIDVNQSEILNISKFKYGGGYRISSAFGNDEIHNVEFIQLNDSTVSTSDLLAQKATPTIFVNGNTINPNTYSGPVSYLEYIFIGESTNDIAIGSLSNDFFNLKEGDDAADGGIGDDVLDGGAGSNFLTGGEGNDTFFLDGRNGNITWSTITDFNFNRDEVNIWGWNEGESKHLATEDSAGADGFKGATFHYDLNNDGTIETSITFSGVSLSEAPRSFTGSIENNGYLWFA